MNESIDNDDDRVSFIHSYFFLYLDNWNNKQTNKQAGTYFRFFIYILPYRVHFSLVVKSRVGGWLVVSIQKSFLLLLLFPLWVCLFQKIFGYNNVWAWESIRLSNKKKKKGKTTTTKHFQLNVSNSQLVISFFYGFKIQKKKKIKRLHISIIEILESISFFLKRNKKKRKFCIIILLFYWINQTKKIYGVYQNTHTHNINLYRLIFLCICLFLYNNNHLSQWWWWWWLVSVNVHKQTNKQTQVIQNVFGSYLVQKNLFHPKNKQMIFFRLII